MIQIIKCTECGGENVPLESISVDIVFHCHIYCDKCHTTKPETRTFFFCSQGCFYKHMAKVMKGEARLEWKKYDQVFGQTT